MQLVRRLTLISAQHQFLIQAAYITGHNNSIADSLSRLNFRSSERCLQNRTSSPLQFHRFQPQSSIKSVTRKLSSTASLQVPSLRTWPVGTVSRHITPFISFHSHKWMFGLFVISSPLPITMLKLKHHPFRPTYLGSTLSTNSPPATNANLFPILTCQCSL